MEACTRVSVGFLDPRDSGMGTVNAEEYLRAERITRVEHSKQVKDETSLRIKAAPGRKTERRSRSEKNIARQDQH